MPIPKPTNQTFDEWMVFCRNSEEVQDVFPDDQQRENVCLAIWKDEEINLLKTEGGSKKMPFPTPVEDERQETFISRCMVDNTMKTEFPDEEQRLSVCSNLYAEQSARDRDKEIEDKEIGLGDFIIINNPQMPHHVDRTLRVTSIVNGTFIEVDGYFYPIREARKVTGEEMAGRYEDKPRHYDDEEKNMKEIAGLLDTVIGKTEGGEK